MADFKIFFYNTKILSNGDAVTTANIRNMYWYRLRIQKTQIKVKPTHCGDKTTPKTLRKHTKEIFRAIRKKDPFRGAVNYDKPRTILDGVSKAVGRPKVTPRVRKALQAEGITYDELVTFLSEMREMNIGERRRWYKE